MKQAIILAGHHEVTAERYDSILGYFQEAGYAAVLYKPDWSKTTPKELVDDFITFSSEYHNATLLGFSLGAMLALIASDEMNVDHLILCSPSGYFSEYVELLGVDDYNWAKSQLKGFEDLIAREVIANSLAKHGYLICGGKELDEWSDFRQWMSDIVFLTHWPQEIVEGVGHHIEDPAYQAAIKACIEKLK